MQVSKLIAVSAIALSISAPARAVTVTIGGPSDANIATDVKDNTIFQNNVNNSDGGGPGMFAGTNGTSSPRRGLIEFNVAANVPAGATITSVQLELFLGQTAGSGGGGGSGTFNIGLYALSANWGEGTAGSGSSGIGGTGQGFAAGAGDATWNASAYPSTLWTNPGGDFAATASATAAVGTTLNVAYTWGSTSAMVANVQSWLNNPATNFGWALVNADETDSQTFRAFWTKEAGNVAGAGTAAMRPELIVTYTPAPEPAAITLIGIGLLVMVAGRRRLV